MNLVKSISQLGAKLQDNIFVIQSKLKENSQSTRQNLFIVVSSYAFILINLSRYAKRKNHISMEAFLPHRWDAGFYHQIASKGYEVISCKSIGFSRAPGFEHVPCGNYMWFPGWPILQKIIAFLTPISLDLIHGWASPILVLLGLMCTWKFASKLHGSKTSATKICIMFLLWPFGFYYYTGFPYGAIFFLSSLYLMIFYSDIEIKYRILILAPIGILLSASYPSSGLYAIIPCWYLFFNKSIGSIKKRITLCFAFGIPFVLGTLSLFAYLEIYHGSYNLFFLGQSSYQRTATFPLVTFWETIKSSNFWRFASFSNYDIFPAEFAIMVVCFYSLCGLYLSMISLKKCHFEFLIFPLAVMLFSLSTGSTESIYRHLLLAYPVLFIHGPMTYEMKNKYINMLLPKIVIIASIIFFIQGFKHFLSQYLAGSLV